MRKRSSAAESWASGKAGCWIAPCYPDAEELEDAMNEPIVTINGNPTCASCLQYAPVEATFGVCCLTHAIVAPRVLGCTKYEDRETAGKEKMHTD